LILAKASAKRVFIPLDLSTRSSYLSLTSFALVRRFPPSSYSFFSLISLTLCISGTWCAYIFISFTGFSVHHSCSVTFSPLAYRLFYSAVIKSSCNE
jgi:hypothetical protein